jgi:hypothetical protein
VWNGGSYNYASRGSQSRFTSQADRQSVREKGIYISSVFIISVLTFQNVQEGEEEKEGYTGSRELLKCIAQKYFNYV